MIERHVIDLRKPLDRIRWLKLRQQDITASDVAAILGVHPKRTAMTVYAQKLGKLGSEDSNIMRRGRWFEPAIIEALADERPDLTVYPAKIYLRDPELRIGATPDFIATDEDGRRGVIEGKIVARPEFLKHWVNGVFLSDQDDEAGDAIPSGIEIKAPLWYELQVLTQAKLDDDWAREQTDEGSGCEWAMVAPLAVDAYSASLHPVEVPIVESAWDFVKERVRDFWDHFDAGRVPDLNPALDAKALAALYPSDDGSALDLSGDEEAAQLVAEWESLDGDLKALDRLHQPEAERIKAIKTELQAKMKNATSIRMRNFEVTWKLQHRKETAATSFRVMRKKRIGA